MRTAIVVAAMVLAGCGKESEAAPAPLPRFYELNGARLTCGGTPAPDDATEMGCDWHVLMCRGGADFARATPADAWQLVGTHGCQ